MVEVGSRERLTAIRRALLRWYAHHKRSLPWRRSRDPYRIWVSEVMLQQTQVRTVIPYYRRFIARYPSLRKLARSELDGVLKIWEGMGYYGRARNLHRAAQKVVSHHEGVIPDTFSDFKQLPGVGDYIAAAVLSIAFQKPLAAIDSNVKRVLSRLWMCEAPVDDPAAHRVYQQQAARMLHPTKPGDFNQALMELGALICTPRHPLCRSCPLRRSCVSYEKHVVEQFPKRTRKRRIPTFPIAVGVVFRKKKVLITQRKHDGLLGGLWEFPGGKVLRRETAESACVREIREETGIEVQVTSFLTRVKHGYTHFKIEMDVFRCRYQSGRVRLKGCIDHRWVEVSELDRFAFPGANRKFIPLI